MNPHDHAKPVDDHRATDARAQRRNERVRARQAVAIMQAELRRMSKAGSADRARRPAARPTSQA